MDIEDWNEDSVLSRAGYAADGTMNDQQRQKVIDRVIDGQMENAAEVLRRLRWLVEDRGHRMPGAQKRWKEDIGHVSREINKGLPGSAAGLYQPEYRRMPDILAGKNEIVDK